MTNNIEKNREICSFMGLEFWEDDFGDYSKHWDLLMPCVEKIGQLDFNTIIDKTAFVIGNKEKYHFERLSETSKEHKTLKLAVFEGVYKFAKWYNVFEKKQVILPSHKKYNPCGGCGAEIPSERCIGCMHDF